MSNIAILESGLKNPRNELLTLLSPTRNERPSPYLVPKCAYALQLRLHHLVIDGSATSSYSYSLTLQ